MLVFECYFCGFKWSNNGGPFVWVQPQCTNCGSTSVGYADEPEQPTYDIEELQYWAEVGRRALGGELPELEDVYVNKPKSETSE
jgi:hypothetical protein